MKNLTFISFSFLLSVCLLPGCKKEEPINNPVHEKLLGTWEWVGTYGGYSYTIKTPLSKGYTFRIEYRRDGKCKGYRNNKQTGVARYSILEGESIFKSYKTFQIKTETYVGIFQDKVLLDTQETIDFNIRPVPRSL